MAIALSAANAIIQPARAHHRDGSAPVRLGPVVE